jgi:hypothetical protein
VLASSPYSGAPWDLVIVAGTIGAIVAIIKGIPPIWQFLKKFVAAVNGILFLIEKQPELEQAVAKIGEQTNGRLDQRFSELGEQIVGARRDINSLQSEVSAVNANHAALASLVAVHLPGPGPHTNRGK